MNLTTLVRAWLLTAVVDGLFASILSTFVYGSTFARLWQGVASVLVGPEALDGGAAMVAVGLMMHVAVAFTWTAVFLLLLDRAAPLRALLGSRYGALRAAAVYGPLIWLVMSLAVIPLMTGRPPAINPRWWVQFAAHVPFVALPMAVVARARMRSDRP